MKSSLGGRVGVRLHVGHGDAVDGADLLSAPPLYYVHGDTHVDDAPDAVAVRALLDHGEERLREREHALDVEREQLGERLVGVLLQRRAPGRARVVDEDVEDLCERALLKAPCHRHVYSMTAPTPYSPSSRFSISLARRRHSSYLLKSPAMAKHLPGPWAVSAWAVPSHALASRDEM